jgi:hypothetical protein
MFRGLLFQPGPAERAGTHEPHRIDDVENRQGQIEGNGKQRQEGSYNGCAGLQEQG